MWHINHLVWTLNVGEESGSTKLADSVYVVTKSMCPSLVHFLWLHQEYKGLQSADQTRIKCSFDSGDVSVLDNMVQCPRGTVVGGGC